MFSKYIMMDEDMLAHVSNYIVEWARGFAFPLESREFINAAANRVNEIAVQRGWADADVRVETFAGRKFGVFEYYSNYLNMRQAAIYTKDDRFGDPEQANRTPLCNALKLLSAKMSILERMINLRHIRAAERVGEEDEPITLVEQKRVIQEAIASFGADVLKMETARVLMGLVNPIMFTAVINCARWSGQYYNCGELIIPNAGSIFAELNKLCHEITD